MHERNWDSFDRFLVAILIVGQRIMVDHTPLLHQDELLMTHLLNKSLFSLLINLIFPFLIRYIIFLNNLTFPDILLHSHIPFGLIPHALLQ